MIQDRVNLALVRGLPESSQVPDVLDDKPHEGDVILAGRGAPALVEGVDLVTTFVEVKGLAEAGAYAELSSRGRYES